MIQGLGPCDPDSNSGSLIPKPLKSKISTFKRWVNLQIDLEQGMVGLLGIS